VFAVLALAFDNHSFFFFEFKTPRPFVLSFFRFSPGFSGDGNKKSPGAITYVPSAARYCAQGSAASSGHSSAVFPSNVYLFPSNEQQPQTQFHSTRLLARLRMFARLIRFAQLCSSQLLAKLSEIKEKEQKTPIPISNLGERSIFVANKYAG
jgi:hypothetical protein